MSSPAAPAGGRTRDLSTTVPATCGQVLYICPRLSEEQGGVGCGGGGVEDRTRSVVQSYSDLKKERREHGLEAR